MMKTQIVLCCDKCEEYLCEQYQCFGFYNKGKDASQDIYLCQNCFGEMVEKVIKEMNKLLIEEGQLQYPNLESIDIVYKIGENSIKLFTVHKIKNINMQTGLSYFILRNNSGEEFLLIINTISPKAIEANRLFIVDAIKSNFEFDQVVSIKSKFKTKRHLEEMSSNSTTYADTTSQSVVTDTIGYL